MAWIDVASAEEVAEGEVRGVRARDHWVALYRIEGRVYATSNVCTHEHALLSDGVVESGEIECPLHLTRFKISDGTCLGPLGTDLACYRTREVGTRVEVQIADEESR
jgi:naphthalene 1,2-dioxygenase system ferredoxin subunit